MTPRRGGALWLALMVAAGVPPVAQAQKGDLVTLINGDRITGEIKGVSRGKLTYDTDDAGQLGIEWVKVVRLFSNRTFEITDRWGGRHVGNLRQVADAGVLVIGDADTLRIVDAVAMAELGASFWQRLNGEADVGFTYTKSNRAGTLSADAEVVYRARDIGASLRFQDYRQKQEDASGISRWSASATASRYLRRDQWSLETVAAMQKNDELRLVRRILGGAGVGRALHRSNADDIQMILGAAMARERFSVDSAADVISTSVDAALILKADVFRFDKPKLTASTELWSFKSLSTAGRVRGDASLDVRYTGLRDFSIGAGVKDFWDTKPPSASARKNDFQTTLTLGWSYRR